MTDQEPRRGLDRLIHLDWLPSRIFGGRMRTSTFILVVAWILTYLLHTYLNPEETAATPPPSVDTSVTEPYIAPSVKPSTTTPCRPRPSRRPPPRLRPRNRVRAAPVLRRRLLVQRLLRETPNSLRPQCRRLLRRRPSRNLARQCRHRRRCHSHLRPPVPDKDEGARAWRQGHR